MNSTLIMKVWPLRSKNIKRSIEAWITLVMSHNWWLIWNFGQINGWLRFAIFQKNVFFPKNVTIFTEFLCILWIYASNDFWSLPDARQVINLTLSVIMISFLNIFSQFRAGLRFLVKFLKIFEKVELVTQYRNQFCIQLHIWRLGMN